jgi:Flp pilus assembly protein TadG
MNCLPLAFRGKSAAFRPLMRRCSRCNVAFGRDRCGSVAIIFALLLIPLVSLAGIALDYARATGMKTKLQAASDAAAMAVSVSIAANPNQTKQQLQAVAQNYLNAMLASQAPQITDFHVCTPMLKDCTSNGATMRNGSVSLGTTTSVARSLSSIVPASIAGGKSSIPVSVGAVVTASTPKTISLNIAFDSSASMIVGATSSDVNAISSWVSRNWNLVKPNDPPPNYPGGDNPPCAFACHDVGGSTGPKDIALGLTHAHSAGATTRFDVMISAGQQLIAHVQTETTNNPQFKNNSYLFNIMSFDTTLHQWGSKNMTSFSLVNQAIQSVTPGLDTHLFNAMSQLIPQLGKQGDGYSSPMEFLILITDGLQSDRGGNWSGGHWAWDGAWSYNTYFGGYATSIDLNQCNQLKNNGIVVAVLETPYVPLTGQSPKVAPYEKTVRKVVYPDGPNTPSAVSQALAACATTGYYFQASSAADIATGFVTLTDKFLYSIPYIAQ